MDISHQAAATAATNGAVPPKAAPAATAAKLRPRDARQTRAAQSFAQVVAVLMRDPKFRTLPIGDLQWLVLPPLMAGQFKLGQSRAPTDPKIKQEGGMLVPVTVALWARVSAEIDAALSASLDRQMHIKPNQWASGDKLWLMTVAGDPRSVPYFLKQLAATEFKDQTVKLRVLGSDGKPMVTTLAECAAQAGVQSGTAKG